MLEQKHYAFNRTVEQPEPATPAAPSEQGSNIRLKTLRELALALLQEDDSLKGSGSLEGKPSVDFSEEVRRFETDLIRWALMRTGGHQRRAARILNLKVTTLNAKIKRYHIQPHAAPAATGNVVGIREESR